MVVDGGQRQACDDHFEKQQILRLMSCLPLLILGDRR